MEGRDHSDQFGIALLLIIATISSLPVADVGGWGRVLSVALGGATLLFILFTARARRATMVVAMVVVAGGIVASTVAVAVAGNRLSTGTPALVGALLAFVAPIVIVRRLVQTPAITRRTVAGALCLYLLAGLFFSFVYALVGAVDEPFFAQAPTDRTVDYVYFSFTTLTTTGFGDLTARGSAGKMLAVSEALIGQLYLVSVVALLVSNIGRERRST